MCTREKLQRWMPHEDVGETGYDKWKVWMLWMTEGTQAYSGEEDAPELEAHLPTYLDKL